MKLLGGISSQQQSAEEAPSSLSAQSNEPEHPVQNARNDTPQRTSTHNVMAEVIERHERISQRVKGK